MSSKLITPDYSEIFTSAAFDEDEIKSDAPDKKYLDEIWSYVLADSYYKAANNNHVSPNRYDDVDWPLKSFGGADPANSTTKFKYRYYYDTPLLALFKSAVELRLEDKAGTIKQVIKIGNGATLANPMLGRKEYPAQLRMFKPNLSAIDRKVEERKKIIKNLRETVGKPDNLRALVAIQSQRRKIEYHPDGNRRATIEIGIDAAFALTVTNYGWNIFQLEQEVKENKTNRSNQELLMYEQGRLAQRFSELVICINSKPTIGFNALEDAKDEFTDKEWRKLMKALPCDRFERLEQFRLQ